MSNPSSREMRPICGAAPDLPSFLAWRPCDMPAHPRYIDHISRQDGVQITWNKSIVARIRRLLRLSGDRPIP
jgi:hypothetical protein